MSKQPYLIGLFRFSNNMNFGLLDFWILFGISGYISGSKRATGDPLVSEQQEFKGFFRFSKENWILDLWTSVFLYSCISDLFGGISDHILGTTRATRDPLVPKQPDFWTLVFL